MEITKNFQAIEELKVSVMLSVSELYKLLLSQPDNTEAVTENIAEILIFIRILEGRLGINAKETDKVAERKLKAVLGTDELREDALRILEYMDSGRRFL